MTDHNHSHQSPDVLDELTTQLLACGGILSQIVGHMVETEASGGSAPDAAPIPAVAHAVIRDAIEALNTRHSKAEIKIAAVILDEVANVMCENIFFVPPGMEDRQPRDGS